MSNVRRTQCLTNSPSLDPEAAPVLPLQQHLRALGASGFGRSLRSTLLAHKTAPVGLFAPPRGVLRSTPLTLPQRSDLGEGNEPKRVGRGAD
jgi:hypothetical protein